MVVLFAQFAPLWIHDRDRHSLYDALGPDYNGRLCHRRCWKAHVLEFRSHLP